MCRLCRLCDVPRARPVAVPSLVLRIRVDAEAAQCPLGIKFGAPPSSAPRLLKLASALGLAVVGVSFHVGSGCREFAVYERAIRAARLVFDQAAEAGYSLTLLDLGGGFAGERGCWLDSLDEAAGHITAALDECFPESEGVTVIAEPGRYMAASAFTLATQVTSVRRSDSAVDYYVNDGVYGAFNQLLYELGTRVPRPLKVSMMPILSERAEVPTIHYQLTSRLTGYIPTLKETVHIRKICIFQLVLNRILAYTDQNAK